MKKEIVFSRASIIAILFSGISTLIVGVMYLYYQFFIINTTKDLTYITMLIIASNVLLFGYYVVVNILNNNLYNIISGNEIIKETLYQKVIQSFTLRKNIWFALLFAISAFIFFAFFLGTWDNNDDLRYLLAAFQTFVGFICGLGIILVFKFVKSTKLLFDQINISFLNYNNPVLKLLLNCSRYTTLFASFYVGVSMTSILFSQVYSYNLFWRLYLTFSLACILIAYLLPLIPITLKMNRAKSSVLNSLERKMNKLIDRDNTNETDSLTGLEYFLQINKIRTKISKIKSNYINQQWVFTITIILISSILPEIVKLIISKIN